jgi:hypothetical protein
MFAIIQVLSLLLLLDGFLGVQQALRLLLAGNSPYLEVLIEENTNDRFEHIILVRGQTGDTRKIAICEFKQCRSLSLKGCLITLGASGLLAYYNPAIGIAILLSKIAVDVFASMKDVSVVAALKALQGAGLIRINNNTISPV